MREKKYQFTISGFPNRSTVSGVALRIISLDRQRSNSSLLSRLLPYRLRISSGSGLGLEALKVRRACSWRLHVKNSVIELNEISRQAVIVVIQ